MEFIIWMW